MLCFVRLTGDAVRRYLLWVVFLLQRGAPLLCLLLFPGCLPLYMAGARMAVSTVGAVASGVAAPRGVPVPQERGALFEAYVNCLKQRQVNPRVDCTPYRTAVEATAR